MVWQNLICLGDSLTTGARGYGCWPAYLAYMLGRETTFVWRPYVRAVNSYTTRDLWWLLNSGSPADWPRPAQVCLMIGTNDCRRLSDINLVRMYYEQLLQSFGTLDLAEGGRPSVFVAPVPRLVCRGRHPYSSASERYLGQLNTIIKELALANQAWLVEPEIGLDALIDGVHFTEDGSRIVARAFADAILKA